MTMYIQDVPEFMAHKLGNDKAQLDKHKTKPMVEHNR